MYVSDKDIKQVKMAKEAALARFRSTGKQEYLFRFDMFEKELSALERERLRQ